MPLFDLFQRWYDHSPPVTSFAIALIYTRSQDSAANCLVASHFSTSHESQHQACVAETLDRDLEREGAMENWVFLSVCGGSTFRFYFMSWEDFCDFNQIFCKMIKEKLFNNFPSFIRKSQIELCFQLNHWLLFHHGYVSWRWKVSNKLLKVK